MRGKTFSTKYEKGDAPRAMFDETVLTLELKTLGYPKEHIEVIIELLRKEKRFIPKEKQYYSPGDAKVLNIHRDKDEK
jgi:regulator of sirC expression with transglutaminase-like and TPR domain